MNQRTHEQDKEIITAQIEQNLPLVDASTELANRKAAAAKKRKEFGKGKDKKSPALESGSVCSEKGPSNRTSMIDTFMKKSELTVLNEAGSGEDTDSESEILVTEVDMKVKSGSFMSFDTLEQVRVEKELKLARRKAKL